MAVVSDPDGNSVMIHRRKAGGAVRDEAVLCVTDGLGTAIPAVAGPKNYEHPTSSFEIAER